MGSSLASGALLRVVGWIVPQSCREEWLSKWRANLAGWQILADRGELTASGGIVRLYRDSVREAFALRMRSEPGQAFLNGPSLVLTAGAAILILIALGTHGFRGARTMFHAPPIQEPAALVSIEYPTRPSERATVLARLVPTWRDKSTLTQGLAGYRYLYNAPRAWVDWNFFALLGTRPAAGRLLQPGDRSAVLLSYPAWRSLYGASPRILGATIQVEGREYRVVGVLPELFGALSPAVDVWIPLTPETQPQGRFVTGTVARLRPGVTPAQLAKELTDIGRAVYPWPRPPRSVRVSSFDNLVPSRGVYLYLVGTLFSIIAALAMVAREQRQPTGHRWPYWPFLAAKTAWAIAVPLLVWMELGALFRTFQPVLGFGSFIARVVALLVFLITCVRGLVWSFADQRRRCPVCLRRLAMPVSIGSPASVFDPAVTELVCPNGHGALSLPEDETDRPDLWTALDSSWDDLFKKKSA